MTAINLVRASRDGDQFHYTWAARRCLLLLSPIATLKAVTIEGPSSSAFAGDALVTTSEEVVDVGEYYGSEDPDLATQIRYFQLKHSTLRVDVAWIPSELENTLSKFAKMYLSHKQRLGAIDLNGKIEFWFVSNRPINAAFLETIRDAALGLPVRHATYLQKIEQFTGLSGEELAAFCSLLHLEGNQEDLWDQQNLLAEDGANYLADSDFDVPIQLKELVTRKALSESANNNVITKMDVLRALKTDERHLFPAPCLIKDLEGLVRRAQEPDIIRSIVEAENIPVIVHAAGGVGKSVFATHIKLGLPSGSWSILYDCFGNGQYRSPTGYRHRNKDALVQIANELSTNGLCHPLIPTSHADTSDYVRAFIYRLKQSVDSLRSKSTNALLCIIIDAADNARMAAEEIGEARSFIRDLIREQLPEGVRLVALCRTHRVEYLNPPPNAKRLELQPFNRTETGTNLRRVFTDATEQDVDEFHRLSSQNPRVQAIVLSRKVSLSETLRALGPNPTTVEDTIQNLLNEAIANLRDKAVGLEKNQLDRICAGLAALRPLIPLSVLASMSGVEEAAIKSFAFDLGRPLLVTGNTIQFFDEPAETWFKNKFKPSADDLVVFVNSLKPLAAGSAYVAAALPQLMLEAGQFSELVALALSSEALPTTNPVERRDVELQRLQFALKASLRGKHYKDAAKLALKAGGESAGDERQRRLLQANTDLASIFLESGHIEELVSRKTFGSGWMGAHHVYEAGLLSGRRELIGDAQSRLRMASEWLRNWSHLSDEEKQKEEISHNDILELAIAHFNVYGAQRCADGLRKWRPRETSFRIGRSIASRFIDHGRYQDLDALASAARNDLFLVLAITLELGEVHRTPPKHVVERAFRLALNPHLKLEDGNHFDGSAIQAVTALVEAAYKLSVGSNDTLIALLSRYLPPSPPRVLSSRFEGARFPFLRAYSLKAALGEQSLNLMDLAHDELRKELEANRPHSESQDLRVFKENIGTLLPWHLLWAKTFVGQISSTDLANVIAETMAASANAERHSYREESNSSDEIAVVWFDILLSAGKTDAPSVEVFEQWKSVLKWPLYAKTLTYLARLAARSTPTYLAMQYASEAFKSIRNERENADQKSDSFIELARAVLSVSPSEALAYFNQAVEVASKIGDENLDRWGAHLYLAECAASRDRPNSETAYRLARCAELTREYVDRDKHFDWESTVEAISGLCAKSSFAILSRWRDRNFGQINRILPIAVDFLTARGVIEPKIALALICFRAHWDEPLLLKKVLEACVNKAEKDSATEFVYRYMSLDQQRVKTWRGFKDVLAECGLSLPELDERIALGERDEQASKSKENPHIVDHSGEPDTSDPFDWNTIFEGIDLSVANEISRAHRRFMDSDPPYYHEHFFEEACRRVPIGKEAEFLAAIADVSDFNLYHLRNLFENIPENWKDRLAVKAAIAETLKAFCRRFCMEISKSRYYEMLPLKFACELAGIPEPDIVDLVLTSIGESAEISGAGRLFTLVGLIAQKLTEHEALEALTFGLDLFDPLLEATDGDGPWSPKLEPPSEIEASVAGYIWGCLAAPQASLRWEAAHVVRALCAFGQEKVIRHLVGFASGIFAHAFYDARLHFYELHALQWLLTGLARAAKDRPDFIAPYADFLIGLAFTGGPHVLIRKKAKQTLLVLLDAGLLSSQADLREKLAAVNASSFSPIESESNQGGENGEAGNESQTDADGNEERFSFGIDMGPYWFDSLGHCFGKSQADIEREASHVIRKEWRISGLNRWDEDGRHRLKIFRDRETHHSHGSYPPVDELRFYLSYHAMMVVAGKLLAATPMHHDPDDPESRFHNWLSRHDLSRRNGGWLADRRDPVPLERSPWKDEKETDDWRWSIARGDFDQTLFAPDGRVNLWGYWKWVSGTREETIRVVSALVSPDRSLALLRALQSADDPHDYRIPDVHDDLQIDVDGFQFKGWVSDRSHDGGIDEQDPWAGEIRIPTPVPADYVIDRMKLISDAESRQWSVQEQKVPVLWSQVWGAFHEKDDDEEKHESGDRLQASLEFMIAFLREVGMDLIVKVEMERRLRYSRWERSKNDTGYIPPSARLFLIRSDGSIHTL